MIKYKRTAINKDAQLHDKVFVIYDEIEQLIMNILNAAVEAGADADKLKELVDE